MNRNVPARHRHIGLVIHGALVAAAAFGIVTATPATANDLWSGTIGQTAVVVELDSGTGGEDDRYFYRRHRLDLRAWGGHVRVWTEYGSGGDVPTGHWAMHTPPPAIGAAWEELDRQERPGPADPPARAGTRGGNPRRHHRHPRH